jgi:5-formyltetrahydrofolate cyclo-ligase
MLANPNSLTQELDTKDRVREWVWNAIEARELARFPKPCHGRIPNFEGAKKAAGILGALEAFRAAEAVFVAPDLALRPCRDRVLLDEKVLAFATPGMGEFKEFGSGTPRRDTSIRGLKRYGDPLRTPISVLILGSVAADLRGNRIGKGRGYGDREVAWLRRRNLLLAGAVVVTVVHPVQVFDDFSSLMEPTDEPVDWIVTPDEVLETRRRGDAETL